MKMKTHVLNVLSILVRIAGVILSIIALGAIINVLLFFAGKVDLADFLFASIGNYLLMDVVMTVLFVLFLPLSVFYMWEKDYSPIDTLDVLLLLIVNFVAVTVWWLMEMGEVEIAFALIYLVIAGISNIIITIVRAFQPFKKPTSTIP